jgi:hypothetical protein
MEDVGMFYGHLVHIPIFTEIWYILSKFGIFCSNLVIFPRFSIGT